MALEAALWVESVELRRREYGDGRAEVDELGDHGSHCVEDCRVERASMAVL